MILLEQQIAELSAYVYTTNTFAKSIELPDKYIKEIYKKMNNTMVVFDDDTSNFYNIAISNDGTVFLGNIADVDVRLLWDSISHDISGAIVDHNGIIPISVITSITNQYAWVSAVTEVVFAYRYTAGESITNAVFPITIDGSNISSDNVHEMNVSLIGLHNIPNTIVELFNRLSSQFENAVKYYKTVTVIDFYQSVCGYTTTIGLLYSYIDFEVWKECECMCIKINTENTDDIDVSNVYQIATLEFTVQRCKYIPPVYDLPAMIGSDTDSINWNLLLNEESPFDDDFDDYGDNDSWDWDY